MELINRNEKEVREYLENLSEDELMQYYNEYADQHSYENIYDNDEEFLEMSFSSISDAIRAVIYGEYTYNDSYIRFDGLASLETTDDITNFVDIDELINDAFESPERYDIEFIDPNDLDDEELFNYLMDNGAIDHKDNLEDYDREELETIGIDSDLI